MVRHADKKLSGAHDTVVVVHSLVAVLVVLGRGASAHRFSMANRDLRTLLLYTIEMPEAPAKTNDHAQNMTFTVGIRVAPTRETITKQSRANARKKIADGGSPF